MYILTVPIIIKIYFQLKFWITLKKTFNDTDYVVQSTTILVFYVCVLPIKQGLNLQNLFNVKILEKATKVRQLFLLLKVYGRGFKWDHYRISELWWYINTIGFFFDFLYDFHVVCVVNRNYKVFHNIKMFNSTQYYILRPRYFYLDVPWFVMLSLLSKQNKIRFCNKKNSRKKQFTTTGWSLWGFRRRVVEL